MLGTIVRVWMGLRASSCKRLTGASSSVNYQGAVLVTSVMSRKSTNIPANTQGTSMSGCLENNTPAAKLKWINAIPERMPPKSLPINNIK